MSDTSQNKNCTDHCISMCMDYRGFRTFGNLACTRLASHLQNCFVSVGAGTGSPGVAKGVTATMGGHRAVSIKPEPAFPGGFEAFARRRITDGFGWADAGYMRAFVSMLIMDFLRRNAGHLERLVRSAFVDFPVGGVSVVPGKVAVANAKTL